MLINLTPHTINLPGLALEPSGQVARVMSTTTVVGSVDGVDVVSTSFGEVEGLPEKVPGTYFVVSLPITVALVRLVSGRTDLLSPGEQTRDAAGKVIGCKNLTR
jgi:hypothetical protein